MIETIWTYRAKPERRVEFERRYAADGDWAKLCSRARGYRGTRLLRDAQEPDRYATVDRWESNEPMQQFRSEHAREYEELDRMCSELTVDERQVGIFEVV